MLASAIIVFREVLEIALILGVLMAATRGLATRNKWVLLGLLGGVAGSALVAAFANTIAGFAAGMGQELFNAGVLLLAAVMIGWTVVWMRSHAREITAHMKKIGDGVLSGELPLYTLSVAIMLATLREGSEIVLFSYGQMAGGETVASILSGGLLGLLAGSLVGAALYQGLIRIPVRHLFSVTGWMLILLAAGMASHAAGLLHQSGTLPEIIYPLWDTSSILPEESAIGEVLHVLVGYTAQPSAMQLVFYLATIGIIYAFLHVFRPAVVKAIACAVIALALFSPEESFATKKVYSPIVEKGELEFELRNGYTFDDDGRGDELTQKYAIGYGFTNRWFTEIYGEFEHAPGEEYDLKAIEWENRFQFTEQGEHWLDAGLLLEYKLPTDAGSPDKLEAFLLLEKQYYEWMHRLNIGAEREVGENSEDEIEGVARWATVYRLNPYFEPGFEYHAELGEVGDMSSFEEQEHQAGPVIYGNFGALSYDLGYLFGLSEEAPDGELKLLLEYGIYF